MAPVFICVCMTAALNPVTGGGMSHTEIAAELYPLRTIHRTTVVYVTAPGEAAHNQTHTRRTQALLCVRPRTEPVPAQSSVFRLRAFVPP